MKSHKPGYVLILAIMIIAVMTLLVTAIVNQTVVFGRLVKTLSDREQAQMLALSGINIAIAQLSNDNQQKTKEQKGPATTNSQLEKFWPLMNRWQTFAFTDEIDGINGSSLLYIASESGKINFNMLYDFKNKKFVKNDTIDGFAIINSAMKHLMLADKDKNRLAELLTTRDNPLVDVTELLTGGQDNVLLKHLFPVESEKGVLSFFDIFTVETASASLQPWFLSKSIATIYGLNFDKEMDKESVNTILKSVGSIPAHISWQQHWDPLFSSVYGKQYSALNPEFRQLFAPRFETSTFSVVSCGKFGDVLVRVYAILIQKPQTNETSGAEYYVKKLYWIN